MPVLLPSLPSLRALLRLLRWSTSLIMGAYTCGTQMAEAALDELLAGLGGDLDIGIFDATNTTIKVLLHAGVWLLAALTCSLPPCWHRASQRRDWIRAKLSAWSETSKFSAYPFFIESICTDDDIIRSNVRETKLKSPDYRCAGCPQLVLLWPLWHVVAGAPRACDPSYPADVRVWRRCCSGVPEDVAVQDFLMRIRHYVAVYQTMQDEEGSAYVKVGPPQPHPTRRVCVFRLVCQAPWLIRAWCLSWCGFGGGRAVCVRCVGRAVDRCGQEDRRPQGVRLPADPDHDLRQQPADRAAPDLAHTPRRERVQHAGAWVALVVEHCLCAAMHAGACLRCRVSCPSHMWLWVWCWVWVAWAHTGQDWRR